MSTAEQICTKCSTRFTEGALFCAHCGTAKPRQVNDELIGKVLGDRFQIHAVIGTDSNGTVYRAEHVTLRRKVAVKVLHHELSRDDLAVERFRREATTVADLDNEHILEIHDFGRTADGRLYMATELLEGETLEQILVREKTLPIDRVADILIQVSEALSEAHAIGYVHRDIRPGNIYLSVRKGQANFVKLLDFGLAKLVEADQHAASTSLGMTFGDPRYMSPEQARGDRIDRRADIYQLGCVAYEMLTGAAPFSGERVFDILTKHVTQSPDPLPSKRKDIPLWLEAAVARMLAKNPENRFVTTTRLAQAIRSGLATGEIMDESVARQRETIPPPSVSRALEKHGATDEPAKPNLRSTQLGNPALDAPVTLPGAAGPSATLEETAKGRPAVVEPNASAKPVGSTTALGHAALSKEATAPVVANAGMPFTERGRVGSTTVASQRPISAVHNVQDLGGAGVAGLLPDQPPPSPRPPEPSAPVILLPPTAASSSAKSGHGDNAIDSRAGKAPDASGVSQVWFAQGDEEEAALGRRSRRESVSSSATDMVDSTPPRRKKALIAAAAAVVLGGGALAFALTRGGGEKANQVATVTFDAALPDAALPDAPQATVDAAPAQSPTQVGATGGKNVSGSRTNVEPPPFVATGNTGTTGDPILDRRPGGLTPPDNSSGRVDPKVDLRPDPKPDGKPDATKPVGVSGTDQTLDPYASSTTVVTTTSTPPGTGSNTAQPNLGEESPAKKAESLAFLGEQAMDAGDAGTAAARFREALENNPRNFTATLGLGQLALRQGSFASAITTLKKATKLAPRNAFAHTLLGEALLGNGNKTAAAEAFKQALRLDADNARAREGLTAAQ